MPKKSKQDLQTAVESKQRGTLDVSSGWKSKHSNGNANHWDDVKKHTELLEYSKAKLAFTPSNPHVSEVEWRRLMWVWARRVRRDILVLEEHLKALSQATTDNPVKLDDNDFYQDPGDPPPPPDEEDGFI